MASASSTSARSLFVESKMRLADRVQVNVNNIASLARQIQRGSKSSEVTSCNCYIIFAMSSTTERFSQLYSSLQDIIRVDSHSFYN